MSSYVCDLCSGFCVKEESVAVSAKNVFYIRPIWASIVVVSPTQPPYLFCGTHPSIILASSFAVISLRDLAVFGLSHTRCDSTGVGNTTS